MIEKIDVHENKKKIEDIINKHIMKNWYIEETGTNYPLRADEVWYEISADKNNINLSRVLSIQTKYTAKDITLRVMDKKYGSVADKIANDYSKAFPNSQVTILL